MTVDSQGRSGQIGLTEIVTDDRWWRAYFLIRMPEATEEDLGCGDRPLRGEWANVRRTGK